MNRLLLAALVAVVLAPAAAEAARPPIYLVVDYKPTHPTLPDGQPARRLVTVRAYDDGDPGACARGQLGYPNRAGSPQVSRCVRELPAEFAPLPQDGGVAKAYVLKFSTPGAPGAAYTLMYDMSTANPPQVCRNLVDFKQKFGELARNTRVQCWVPKAG